jgi:hypothetical protein
VSTSTFHSPNFETSQQTSTATLQKQLPAKEHPAKAKNFIYNHFGLQLQWGMMFCAHKNFFRVFCSFSLVFMMQLRKVHEKS